MNKLILLSGLFLLGALQPAFADLQVFTCEPTWASLARELGGDRVEVNSATTAFQDVHYIQARPSLLARARSADLLICSGAQLEIGWLPILLRQSGNPAIQTGQPGFFAASQYVQMLDVPATLDRAAGDIHPYGNPHIQTDPHNIAAVAKALSARLAELDPDGAALYAASYQDFAKRWDAAIARWEAAAAPLRGVRVVPHHKAWVYLFHWLGLIEAGTLEPKPGVPPSAADLARLLDTLAQRPAAAIIRAPFKDARPSDWLAERTGMPALVLPLSPGGVEGADDLFGMFDVIINRLLTTTGHNTATETTP